MKDNWEKTNDSNFNTEKWAMNHTLVNLHELRPKGSVVGAEMTSANKFKRWTNIRRFVEVEQFEGGWEERTGGASIPDDLWPPSNWVHSLLPDTSRSSRPGETSFQPQDAHLDRKKSSEVPLLSQQGADLSLWMTSARDQHVCCIREGEAGQDAPEESAARSPSRREAAHCRASSCSAFQHKHGASAGTCVSDICWLKRHNQMKWRWMLGTRRIISLIIWLKAPELQRVNKCQVILWDRL